MRLAFCLYKYFPHGGLARDMLRLAREAASRGHEIRVFTGEWQGEAPADLSVTVLGAAGWTNHGRAASFGRRLARRLADERFDAVVGFNKLPGLDFYFAADGCYAARARRRYPRAYELTPRYRTWRRLESAVFGPAAGARILLLSEAARLEYRGFYATGEARMHLLPPGLDHAHRALPLGAARREAVRASLDTQPGERLLLMVGSSFHTKGVDRTVSAVAALPEAERRRVRLVVVGRGKAAPQQRRVERLGLGSRVCFAGARDDVPELLRAADLLVHPARQENTGTVLLEALAAGLPVVTTGNCGYAAHVREAQAGIVLDPPFRQGALDQALRELLQRPDRAQLAANAAGYGRDESFYRMPAAAMDVIERRADIPSPPAFTGYVHPELADLARRLPRLEDWLALNGELYRRTRDRRTLRFEHRGRGYFLKAHCGIGWREVLKNLGQAKLPVLGAGNEWLASHCLAVLGIPTPSPVAFGCDGGRAHQRSFIVTRELTNMTSLEEHVRHPVRDPGAVRRRRRLIGRVADTARALHANGINHRDFYLCHFLFDPAAPEDADPPLHLIDLHRAQVRHRTPRRWRIKDIAGLYYSALGAGLTRHERLRFIQRYTGAPGLRPALADIAFWRRVERRALRLQRAERRRGYADSAGTAARLDGRLR